MNALLSKRSCLQGFIVAAALFAVSGSSAMLFGQARPAPGTQDPTRPEIQPRLDVDHDPIASPDPEEVAPPVTATAPGAAPKPGEIQKKSEGVYTMHADVDEVLQQCAVVDEKGKTVPDLTLKDFHVWEDGVPQTTTSFLHQDQPVSLGILVDNSGSMRDKRTAVNQAALSLLRASNPLDASFVVNFNDHAILDQGFTSDISLLDRGLSHYDARGTTALYDAVTASADELSKHAKLPKQVLLVITDGADNASRQDLATAIRRVQNLGGPVVYTIGLLYDTERDEADRAHSDLEKLSEETGGIAYFPSSINDVNGIALEVAHDIRDQYTIGYRSNKSATLGGFRVVHVEASAPKHGKLFVRTRRGYYANRPTTQPTQTAQATNP